MSMPNLMDPMYWLGSGGLFGSAVLVGVMVIIFVETGLLFPFLPGDTLLFTAGVIAAQPGAAVDMWSLAPCAALAAVLGSQCGYFIGRRVGPALYHREDSRFFKRRYLTSAHEFFDKHGPKTLVIAQFVGVVRTFTPVAAGISAMRYPAFLLFNVVGSVAWGVGLPLTGYFLGNVSIVRQHIELIVLVIAFLSALPFLISVGRAAINARRTSAHGGDRVQRRGMDQHDEAER
ncbi:MAG: VTT domain-containing protein, partial [Mycobacteriaceae bacterium]|nr:VTT domain-containing protein [Mycobacteriaceae bacterium]